MNTQQHGCCAVQEGRRYCNFCDAECTDAFVHGKTVYGMWANLCVNCNLELGTGPGELYVFKNDNWQRKY